MDAADLKLGQRVYNKNGKLMAIDLNRQVDILNRQDAANWPTPKANDPEKRGDFNPLDHRTGLPGAVKLQQHGQANWPTPDASNHRDGEVLRKDNNLEQGGFHGVSLHHAMTKYGQAAPANPSTDGSRQESWATPNAFCYQPPENTEKWTKRAEYQQTEKGVNLHKPIQTQVLHEVEKQWRTPSSSDGEGGVMEMREGCAGKYKLRDHVVAEEKMWRTPSVAEEKNQNTSTQIYLQNQVGATPKAWATPQASDHIEGARTELTSNQKCLGRDMKQWATPIMGDSHLASTPEVAQKRIEEGKVTLSRQTAAWATPQLQDGHNINQDSTTHKTIPAQLTKMNMAGKLNPRWVETLMGLPVGWVMPSCKSPVTIEPTSFDSSATESCLPQPRELFEF
jgi:hypothetical protein